MGRLTLSSKERRPLQSSLAAVEIGATVLTDWTLFHQLPAKRVRSPADENEFHGIAVTSCRPGVAILPSLNHYDESLRRRLAIRR
jgi:hypothetical protein